MARIRIGISGWTYPDWRGKFYPKKWPQKRELEYASRALSSIEINGTFYSLQKPSSFQAWYKETPDDFQFAVKGGQFLTHVLRVKDVENPLCNFLASGLLCLKRKLGPILWQFPPNVMLKDNRFEIFARLLPRTAKAAAELAKQHSPKFKGRTHFEVEEDFPIRHAFEFRHPSFQNSDFYSMLKEHNVALVVSHGNENWPFVDESTADFVYARLQDKSYSPARLREWGKRVKEWAKRGRDVFIYLSEEKKENSPRSALQLLDLLEPRRDRATAKPKDGAKISGDKRVKKR